jgi:hypothetical protein
MVVDGRNTGAEAIRIGPDGYLGRRRPRGDGAALGSEPVG